MTITATVVVAAEYGGPEVLSLVERTLPSPGPGEVLVAVGAAAVNPADWKAYGGMFGTDPSRLPLAVGSEAAGTVLEVGPGASGPAGPVRVGDEVIAYRISGAYATAVVVVPADAVLPRPRALSVVQAAGLLLAGSTAVHALTATGVGAGDTVLVHAAAGGVGRIAVQLARRRGARVIGTAATAAHEDLRALGVEPVVYGDGLLDRVRALAPDGIDAAVDTVGTDEALDVSLAVVPDRDRIATIANVSRGPAEGVRVLGAGPGADPGTAIRDAARLELVRLADDGGLDVQVARTFALTDVAAAQLFARDGHPRGKVVLVP